jgi:hypothetical protein
MRSPPADTREARFPEMHPLVEKYGAQGGGTKTTTSARDHGHPRNQGVIKRYVCARGTIETCIKNYAM